MRRTLVEPNGRRWRVITACSPIPPPSTPSAPPTPATPPTSPPCGRLASVPGPAAADAFGSVGARFVAALTDAVAQEVAARQRLLSDRVDGRTPSRRTQRPGHTTPPTTSSAPAISRLGRSRCRAPGRRRWPRRSASCRRWSARGGRAIRQAIPPPHLAAVRDALADVAVGDPPVVESGGASWVGDAGGRRCRLQRATTVAAVEAPWPPGSISSVPRRRDRGRGGSRARARLQAIVDEFEARAAALESDLDAPGAADGAGRGGARALDEANAVVDELRAELDGHAAAVEAPAPAPAPPPTRDDACRRPAESPAVPSVRLRVRRSGRRSGRAPVVRPGRDVRRPSPGLGRSSTDVSRAGRCPTPATFGSGVAVQLPDGSTATAPNAVAASAVRHALTQLGVPYDWGGTTPGVGLDCSGLTQWAYHEAGLDLPRLAQEQDVGSAVDPGTLATGRPGGVGRTRRDDRRQRHDDRGG